MFFFRFFIISLFVFNVLSNNQKDKTIFISPLKIPVLLSSNFGELRIDHFHSGLDLKTQGVTGKEVVAAASGYIYRISVSPGGFGKALYIRHTSGYSTVYGHLERFSPRIEEYVKNRQYEEKSFLITLFPSKDKFPVNQGEIIAYSGNSGSSGGPHLHYEIRKSENETPVNPLLFEFGNVDNIKPVIEKLVIYPINHHSFINDQNTIKKLDVSGKNGNYFISSENEIRISGLTGFGIKSFDLMGNSNNRCAVYSIELKIDSIALFKYIMDGFSFNESRFVNSHIDYEMFQKEKTYIERVFVLPNDKLSVYQDVENRGIFNFNDNKSHHIEIIVKDINNNKSVLSFRVKAQTPRSHNTTAGLNNSFRVMPYNRSNHFETKDISISIPSGALYDTLSFSYKKISGTIEMLSDLHYVHNRFTPVHKAYKLSIKPRIIPTGKESKMLIIQLGDDQKKNPVNSTWSDGYLTANVLSFGKFYVGIDNTAPVISPNGLVQGANLTAKKEIKIKITDDLSGIKSYEPSIDGKWALFEYDQKNNLLVYQFDEKRITRGIKHNLSLKVTDNKDNINFYNCDFTW
ncbi:MAG: M23 family metallopeptidase [Bacteroidales bacterium]|nr:M23 family metallopeptidase [Bacteroidales bacterium]